jgi:hypothetical protein
METDDADLTYNDLFIKFPEESNASIGAAYDAIEQLLVEAEAYFQVNHYFNQIRIIFLCIGLAEISSSMGFRTK